MDLVSGASGGEMSLVSPTGLSPTQPTTPPGVRDGTARRNDDLSFGLDVAALRAATPGCEQVIHLNNAGCALPTRSTVDAVIAHLQREMLTGGYEAHAAATAQVDDVYAAIGTLVGVPADRVAVVESATVAWDRAFTSIGLRPGDRILTSTAEYASNVLPMLQLASTGVRVDFVPDDGDGVLDVDAAIAMLDDDVRLVAVTHAPSQNGLLNPVEQLGDLLRRSGSTAWYLVDACQSVGQRPVDATLIGCDFLAATGRKFLRGPRGTGFLAVSERALVELEPYPLDLHSATWTDAGYDVAPTARRYETWERSYAAMLGLGVAVRELLDLGVEPVAARIAALARHLRPALQEIPAVSVHDRGPNPSGIVTLTHATTPAADVIAVLRAAGINASLSPPDYALHDFRAHGLGPVVRFSPHVFNTVDELDHAADVIAGLS